MVETQTSFNELGLPENLLQAVTELGYITPTPIQAQAIPALLAHHDVMGVAQTGTGKTAAFGLPMLTHVDPQEKQVQALVLAPTRELALQGADAVTTFAAKTEKLNVVAVYGGAAYGPQLGALKDGAQVVVGTPGRIMDLMDRGALTLEHVRYFVLDEADEMLRMGFAEDVEKIASALPKARVSALFSATMPNSIRKIATEYLHDPIEITVTPAASTVDTIEQTFAVVPNRHKIGALTRVLATTEAAAALVFVRTRATAEELSLELTARGVHAAALSGDVAQTEREKLVNRLRTGFLDVLVATDVAARGLDVERIGLVVNFDVPREVDTYVHRIGRTGRAGREGVALTFVTPKERSRLRRIEAVTKSSMTQVELPTPAEVSAYRSRKLITQAEERYAAGRLWVYADVLAKYEADSDETKALHDYIPHSLDDWIEADAVDVNSADVTDNVAQKNTSATEIAAQATTADTVETAVESAAAHSKLTRDQLLLALMALSVRDFGPSDQDAEPDILTSSFSDSGKDRNSKSHRRKESSKGHTFAGVGTMYRVEVGKRDGVKPGSIVGAITGEGGLRSSQLGRIDIYPSFSIVEFAHELDETTMRKIARAKVQGRELNISRDRGPNAAKKAKKLKSEAHREHQDHRAQEWREQRKGELREYSDAETRKYRADKKYGEEKRARLESFSRDERRSAKFGTKSGKGGNKHHPGLKPKFGGKHSGGKAYGAKRSTSGKFGAKSGKKFAGKKHAKHF